MMDRAHDGLKMAKALAGLLLTLMMIQGCGRSGMGTRANTDADGGAGPSCKYVGPCTATEVITSDGWVTTTSYVYDDHQRLIREEATSGPNGSQKTRVTYTYDKHGWLLESKSNDCGETEWGCRWFIYTYDSAGRVLTVDDRSDYSGREPGCTTNTYDKNGRLVRKTFAPFCEKRFNQDTTYEYDSLGRLITERRSFDGKPGAFTSYAYDASGFLLSSTHHNSTGSVDEIVVFTRDAAGNPLVEVHQRKDGVDLDYTILRTFDSAGHQLGERTRHSQGPEAGLDMWCWTRTFDSCGNPLTEERWQSRCDEPPSSRTSFGYECF